MAAESFTANVATNAKQGAESFTAKIVETAKEGGGKLHRGGREGRKGSNSIVPPKAAKTTPSEVVAASE